MSEVYAHHAGAGHDALTWPRLRRLGATAWRSLKRRMHVIRTSDAHDPRWLITPAFASHSICVTTG